MLKNIILKKFEFYEKYFNFSDLANDRVINVKIALSQLLLDLYQDNNSFITNKEYKSTYVILYKNE